VRITNTSMSTPPTSMSNMSSAAAAEAAELFAKNGIQDDVAELAGLVVEGIVYGFFLALFLSTLTLLFTKRQSRVMLGAVIVMFLLATAQIIVDTVNIFMAFVDLPDRISRLAFLENPTLPIFAAKHAIFFTMIWVGDVTNTYRCFLVWDRRFLYVLVPLLLSFGSAFCAYQTIWATQHVQDISIAAETSWGIAIFSLSIAANLYSTSLIAWRIWINERRIAHLKARSSRTSLMPIVYIVVESGALNAAYLIAYMIVLQVGSHGIEIFAEFSTPFVGVIFCLMLLRLDLKSKQDQARKMAGPSMLASTTAGSVGRFASRPGITGTNPEETQVHITVDTHNDKDVEMGSMDKYGSRAL